jgi:hypothetical protein
LLPILREKVKELELEEKRDKSKSNVVTSAFGEAFYKNLSLKKNILQSCTKTSIAL